VAIEFLVFLERRLGDLQAQRIFLSSVKAGLRSSMAGAGQQQNRYGQTFQRHGLMAGFRGNIKSEAGA
jgi:hypothetical protein